MYWYLSRHHQMYRHGGTRYGWGPLNYSTLHALVRNGTVIQLLAPADRRRAGAYRLRDNWIYVDDSKTPVRAEFDPAIPNRGF